MAGAGRGGAAGTPRRLLSGSLSEPTSRRLYTCGWAEEESDIMRVHMAKRVEKESVR